MERGLRPRQLVELFGTVRARWPRSSASPRPPPGTPNARSRRPTLHVIARAAHRLKGASGMIGAAALREIAEAVERAAKAEDLPTVRRLREMFSHEVRRVAEQAGVPVD